MAMDTLSKEMLLGRHNQFLRKIFTLLITFIAIKTKFSVSSSITYCVLESKVHKIRQNKNLLVCISYSIILAIYHLIDTQYLNNEVHARQDIQHYTINSELSTSVCALQESNYQKTIKYMHKEQELTCYPIALPTTKLIMMHSPL